MLRFIVSFMGLYTVFTVAVASQLPTDVTALSDREVVIDRTGMYKVKVNATIVKNVLCDLERMFKTDADPSPGVVRNFKASVKNLTYVDPSTIVLDSKFSDLRGVLFYLRQNITYLILILQSTKCFPNA